MSFQTFAKINGIHLLKDDIVFIKACLAKMPSKSHKTILSRYAEEWLQGMRETDIVYRRQNLGRRKANLWLLGVVGHGFRNSEMV